MDAATDQDRTAVGIEALELFVGVLSQEEGGSPAATLSTTGCARRSAGWRRCAGRSSSATTARRRRVRAVGSHGVDLEQFAEAHVTVESAPIAAQALLEDRVLEIAG